MVLLAELRKLNRCQNSPRFIARAPLRREIFQRTRFFSLFSHSSGFCAIASASSCTHARAQMLLFFFAFLAFLHRYRPRSGPTAPPSPSSPSSSTRESARASLRRGFEVSVQVGLTRGDRHTQTNRQKARTTTNTHKHTVARLLTWCGH